jgi:hypothetical protein
MKSCRVLALVCLFGALTLAVSAAEKKETSKEPAKHTGLDSFKKLAGEWTGKMAMDGNKEHPVTIIYKVTSGGSAVVETIAPGTPHEMVTVFNADGNDLMLTHYCMLGNQPRMKAECKGQGDKFDFQFVSATNMKSDKDMHMHSVVYTLVDKDTLKADWTHFMDGKSAGIAKIELKRIK